MCDGSAYILKAAPAFEMEALIGTEFGKVSLEKNMADGKWTVLFFYPLNFTFVCPTEILGLNAAIPEFEKLNARVIGVSIDSVFSHLAWTQAPSSLGGLGKTLAFPLGADITHSVSKAYRVQLEGSIATRGTFVIDPKGVLRWISIYPTEVGRNIDEIVRVVAALQVAHDGTVCPVNWTPKSKTMQTTLESRNSTIAEMTH